ncbi:uncharacterized protein LOC143513818 [Brachyhypopomus gauderio]|uniref:uncharacterized protein LOC143513818 n=1 Tax=Brachyhypopomus gauderio TaxID=698409 RepID=UPI004041E412
MISLHWILALTLASLHCLTARHILTKQSNTFTHLKKEVNKLSNLRCEPHQILYKYSDAPAGCEREALHCLHQQLNETANECFLRKNNTLAYQYCRRAQYFLVNGLPKESPTCTWTCKETNQTKEFSKFLEDLLEWHQKSTAANS